MQDKGYYKYLGKKNKTFVMEKIKYFISPPVQKQMPGKRME